MSSVVSPGAGAGTGATGGRGASAPRFRDRLVVVSCAMHYRWGGQYHAYAAYTREMDLWAQLFSEVVIAAPLCTERPPGDSAPFAGQNVRVVRQRMRGGDTVGAKLRELAALPWICRDLVGVFRQADAIHVRCPGNLALPALFLAPLFTRRLVAKYAGQWSGYPEEPASYRLQRSVLSSRWWHGPVTVYGSWPGQPGHVVPFFTSVMTEAQLERARAVAAARRLHRPLRLLYVGRLAANKNVDSILESVAALTRDGVPVEATIVGDGPVRGALERLASDLGVTSRVRFTGALAYDDVLQWYERSDVLVLVSESEGWGKAVAEAMAFGMVCVGSDHGFMAQMLGEGRGIVVPSHDAAALTAALRRVAADPDGSASLGANAAIWAQRFSLEGLRDALGELLADRWAASSEPGDRPAAAWPARLP